MTTKQPDPSDKFGDAAANEWRSEFDSVEAARIDAATGDGAPVEGWPPLAEERAAAAVHQASAPHEPMPERLRASISRNLDDLIAEDARAEHEATIAPLAFASPPPPRSRLPWVVAIAAVVAGAITVGIVYSQLTDRSQKLQVTQDRLEELESQIGDNALILAASRARIGELESQVQAEGAKALAESKRNVELAAQLADASAAAATHSRALDEAQLRIAKLEKPIDPALAQQSRTKLLEVPDTIRIAWAPFELEGAAPAEQRGIQGDVVWNDRLETGYLRFVGLRPNDPAIEQYQVWVIDERGLEQKVSGGVFNATASGEVIVPIKPGIDVGRVALFAVTVEKPGGTWVPDLKRRVVVAPVQS